MVRILLIRHGETAWNLAGRQQGRIDIPLSETGRVQARALADRLRSTPLARAVASPLLRARQTAEAVLEGRTLPLTLDPDLKEMDHGQWEGLLQEDIQARFPEDLRGWRQSPHLTRPTGGEGFAEVLDRARPALARACEGLGADEVLLLATHDGVCRALLAWVLGLPFERIWSFRLAPTSVNLLEGPHAERLSLVRLNDAAHIHPFFGESVHRRL